MKTSTEQAEQNAAMLLWIHHGDDCLLRRYPEGRAMLLDQARERRKEPLFLRRYPAECGRSAAKFLYGLIVDTLKEYEANTPRIIP